MKLDIAATTLLCPNNDGEAATIFLIARKLGLDIRESNQPWGATLDKEPPGSFLDLKQNVIIVEIPGVGKEDELRSKHAVFIIDHHRYETLDRRNPKSSLEQFAALMGYNLNRQEMGIALNDRGYIPALDANGYNRKEIDQIRKYDLVHQGYDTEAFSRQKLEYASGRLLLTDLFLVTTGDILTSYISDLHFWACRDSAVRCDLLTFTLDSATNVVEASFSGAPHRVNQLHHMLGGFSGGDEKASMYWGKKYEPHGSQTDCMHSLLSALEFSP